MDPSNPAKGSVVNPISYLYTYRRSSGWGMQLCTAASLPSPWHASPGPVCSGEWHTQVTSPKCRLTREGRGHASALPHIRVHSNFWSEYHHTHTLHDDSAAPFSPRFPLGKVPPGERRSCIKNKRGGSETEPSRQQTITSLGQWWLGSDWDFSCRDSVARPSPWALQISIAHPILASLYNRNKR